jgi:RecB family exonuclease
VITPRRTRLVRVADLHAFRHAIGTLCAAMPETSIVRETATASASGGPKPDAVALVVVPTRGAARQLVRARGRHGPVPDAVTRDQLYDRMHARLAVPPPRLSAFEREVIAQAAARHAKAGHPDLPFRLRPGLVAEILRFYDLLRRQSQQVHRFEALIEEQLAGHSDDPGADRMLRQTRFLSEAFREYERRANRGPAVDEHALRERLIAEPSPDPVRCVIVAVPDWIADPDGLYVADFDLLTRIPGLDALDVVATEATLESGFHERLHAWLPGIEEVSAGAPPARGRPTLMTPDDPAGALWFTHRDREEELLAAARQIKSDRAGADVRQGTGAAAEGPSGAAVPLDRIAVVFKRPLPYLYLADDTLGAAGIPYQISDALPLGAEPTAAAIDLAVDLAARTFSRSAIIALLRSPHFVFSAAAPGGAADAGERRVSREEVSALDRALSSARYLGEAARLESLAAHASRDVERPLAAALAAVRELAPLTEPHPASTQLRRLVSFFEGHARPIDDADPFAPRERRARAAIQGALARLADAHAAHDDPAWTVADLAAAVRRWIEAETFVPDTGQAGVHLLDDQAARFADLDDITIAGLIEGDWPEPPRRNIFYPPNLMKALGWPSEKDRHAAAEARFLDLLASASRRVTLSVITLDDEALVEPSSLLEEISRARLSTASRAVEARRRISFDDALAYDPIVTGVLPPGPRAWADMRVARSPHDSPAFHGMTGVRDAGTGLRESHGDLSSTPAAWSVSSLETYLGCPFKFFAQHVLRLDEEPDDEEVMDPRKQGQFVHEVFEEFFTTWQAQGRGAVTPANLDEARDLFAAVVDRLILRLPTAEAGLERTRLLGSSAAAGLGDAVLRMEAERPVAVVERLLEHRLEGDFTIATEAGPRTVALKGKADRVDLLADGTFRLIDYKLGWAPQRTRALQLPIYSLCAEQRLAGRGGRQWVAGEAVYLAFRGPRRVVPLFTTDAERASVLAKAQERLAVTIDAIARGEFPATPDDVHRCETCSFAAVCRKDYVGDV